VNLRRSPRFLFVVVVLLSALCAVWMGAGPAGASRTQHPSPASQCDRNGDSKSCGCDQNDTSGSCDTLRWEVVVAFPKCVRVTPPCAASQIRLTSNKRHAYNLHIVIPTPAKRSPSILAGYTLFVTMDKAGNFTLRVMDRRGHLLTSWSPRLIVMPPPGYRVLMMLTKGGWRAVDYSRVGTRGIYKWVRR
jgi:hypothetical protein